MTFGLRRPSPRKSVAARPSWRRDLRHSLEAPRGWGWIANPRRAAHDRAYSRTAFSWRQLLLRLPG